MRNEFNAALASRIYTARKSARMTQQQVADAIGVHQNIVQRFEAGKHRISAFDLVRLSEAMGASAPDILASALSSHPVQSEKEMGNDA